MIDNRTVIDFVESARPVCPRNFLHETSCPRNFCPRNSYAYDGLGNRVAKGGGNGLSCDNNLTPTGTFIVGPNGEQLDALNANGALYGNVFANGQLLATYQFPTANWTYALNDWLGTKRFVAKADGSQGETCIGLPFGDGLNCTGTGGDPSSQHFTGKERDSETSFASGNDYFGARYYSSATGRFLSPDWSNDPDPIPNAEISNPQALNLYSYVNNNPLTYTDPDGHCWQGFQWACDLGQAIDNGFHGVGFHTDAQVEQNIHNAQQYLRNNTSITPGDLEKLSNKQVLDRANGAQSGKESVISDSVRFVLNVSQLTPWGWRGQQTYNDAAKKLNEPNTPQGTTDLPDGIGGKVPTRAQAKQMIEDAGGKVIRGEELGHAPGGNSPHTYPHINYETAQGMKGTIRVTD